MTTPPEVIKLIQENQECGEKSLNLSWKKLTEIPEEVYQLTHLEDLYLRNNGIKVIPEKLYNLPQLHRLDIRWNPIQQLADINGLILDYDIFLAQRVHLTPAHIIGLRLKPISNKIIEDLISLPQLTLLDLTWNQLNTLPDEIAKLSQLTSLDLRYNQLNILPESIMNLTQLLFLDLRYNRLNTLPDALLQLSQLTSLSLGYNQLSILPKSLSNLSQLTSLDLGYNQLSVLPESVILLVQLTSLNLSWNQLKIIPNIQLLTHLEKLELDHNPIENPPIEIVDQGIDALREYFAALDLGAVENNRAKLILVGNGRVGKTCISKVLAGEPCKENEKSTHGIRVVPLSLPNAPHLDFQVWDFGGQDIYHATHRFFLSRRALYLLVWDSDTEQRAGTSQQDGEFTLEYWLDNIAEFSDNSPVLVIQNKVDDTPPLHLPQDKLAEHYEIKEFLKVSAKTGRGFDELKHQIAAQFQPEQPLYRMVGYKMPKTWLDLRDQLHHLSQRKRRPVYSITYENYLKRCNQLKINATAAAVLCRFLHETASILYFSDEPKLKDLIAINPRWVAEKIYDDENDKGVLNQQVKQQHGKFTRAHVRCQLAELSEAEQDNFINLLKKFELCFKVADPAEPNTFIAPQYLPSQQPQTVTWEWQTRPHPKFIYEYQKTIHHSVMVRFITRFGHLAQQQQYWRDGILFKQHDAIALVECHHAERKITVHLKNDSTGQLARTIDENFNEINYYIDVTLFVPCCCAECEKTEDFHRYEVEKLKEFITEKRKMTVECSKSAQMVEIGKLVGAAMLSHWLHKDMVTAAVELPVRTQPTESDEKVIEDNKMTEDKFNTNGTPPTSEPTTAERPETPKTNGKLVDFALNLIEQSIRQLPILGDIRSVTIGLAAILFIAGVFVPNIENLVYGGTILLILTIFVKAVASPEFRFNDQKVEIISWVFVIAVILVVVAVVLFFASKLFKLIQ